MNYLFSPAWWQTSNKLALANYRRLILPAVLLALSNYCSAFSESLFGGGLDLGTLSTDSHAIEKLISLLLELSIASMSGLLIGFFSLSIWLIDLTALARRYFLLADLSYAPAQDPPSEEILSAEGISPALKIDAGKSEGAACSFDSCLEIVKSHKSYFGQVWLVALLYLLGLVIPMSALIAFTQLARMDVKAFGESLLVVPSQYLLPMNIAAGILALLVLDFSLILTALSSRLTIKPLALNSMTAMILFKQFGNISILNFFLIFLNVIISTPLAIADLVPATSNLSKNLAINFISQLWFAITIIWTWPISILMVCEFLKPLLPKQFDAIKSQQESLK